MISALERLRTLRARRSATVAVQTSEQVSRGLKETPDDSRPAEARPTSCQASPENSHDPAQPRPGSTAKDDWIRERMQQLADRCERAGNFAKAAELREQLADVAGDAPN